MKIIVEKKALEIKKTTFRETIMSKWECRVCGYVYDPMKGDQDNGVKPGTGFENIQEDWVCPVCSAGKDAFDKLVA